MAKNQYAGAMEYQRKMQKKLDLAKVKIRCECYHHGEDSFAPSLEKAKGANDGNNKYAYLCTNCTKPISLKALPEKNRLDSINTVDLMIDLIKMQCNPNKPEEKKLISMLAKFQFKLVTGIEDLYKVKVLGVGKKKNRNKKNGEGSSFWGKPVYR